MNLARRITALLLVAAGPALAGPFGNDQSGIAMTSAVFRAWIANVVNAQHPAGSGGFARNDSWSPTDATNAVRGMPLYEDDSGSHVLSLGNGGSVVATFDEAIYDGSGPDFAVFENADPSLTDGDATNLFAELAFVEVGTTTNAWARFPSTYLGSNIIYATTAVPSNYPVTQDVTLLDGLAGKHAASFGTPFDLAALKSNTNVLNGSVDLHCIRFIRIIDVIGDGSTFDSSHRPIYDPYYDQVAGYPNAPAPSVLDGFDLRAIGLINSGALDLKPGGKLSWFAVSNNTWQIQFASALAGPWSNLTATVSGNDATNSATDATGGARRFYRLQRWRTP